MAISSVHEIQFFATRFVYWQTFELILADMRLVDMMTLISRPFSRYPMHQIIIYYTQQEM